MRLNSGSLLMSEVTSLAPRPWMRPPKGSWVGLLSAGRGNRYYRYQRRGRQFKIAQMLAAKVLDEHEWIMRKLDHRRAWYASSSRSACSRPGSVAGDPCGGTTMPVARCSTLLLTRIAWWNGGRQGVRKTQVRRPSGPVACQSRRSAGPLRRGCAQRADPNAAAPVLTERGLEGAGRPDQRPQQRYPHALFFRAPPGVSGLQVAPFHSGLGSRELFGRPVSD
jgi:hypothetical protein